MSNTLTLVQNTSSYFILTVANPTGAPISLTGARTVFLVTDVGGLTTYILKTSDSPAQISIYDIDGGQVKINIIPTDTATIPLGQYRYSATVTLTDGTVYDVITASPLFVVAADAAPIAPTVLAITNSVDHNFGATDALRYLAPDGTPIADAQVRIYLLSDYTAGHLNAAVGTTMTDAQGRWKAPILVTPGATYVVYLNKPNSYGPDTFQIVV